MRFPVLSHLAGEGVLQFCFFGLQLLVCGVMHIGHRLQFGNFVLQRVHVIFQLTLLVLNLNEIKEAFEQDDY